MCRPSPATRRRLSSLAAVPPADPGAGRILGPSCSSTSGPTSCPRPAGCSWCDHRGRLSTRSSGVATPPSALAQGSRAMSGRPTTAGFSTLSTRGLARPPLFRPPTWSPITRLSCRWLPTCSALRSRHLHHDISPACSWRARPLTAPDLCGRRVLKHSRSIGRSANWPVPIGLTSTAQAARCG